MTVEIFPVFDVPDDAPELPEQMGSKDKFWFRRGESPWLFKQSRNDQGEDWAEVLAERLAILLGLPAARYELARWKGHRGVVSQRFTSDGHDFVPGNELLAQRDPDYPQVAGSRHVRTQEHTITAVSEVLGDEAFGLPHDWNPLAGVTTPRDVFAGYLLLDAWIANTDRHHGNWGLVFRRADGRSVLAPTFDHAASLGAHETDANRGRRLSSNDPKFRVSGYVQKARSALFAEVGDAAPMSTLGALIAWSRFANVRPWLYALGRIDAEVDDLLARFPPDVISGPAQAFARAMLDANRERILEALE